ncbi:MAG TPA: DUF4191 domain-containing protein [Nocardioidaceae bacterium]|nr:DUF4191 domain-containing protein [Nocardioidaceae bacterium]
MSTTPEQPRKGRLRQIAQAYRITKQHERFLGLRLFLWFLVIGGAVGAAGWFLLHPIFGAAMGVMTGLLAALVVFGRRAEQASYAQVEGQIGAAAGALQMLKRGWSVKPAIALTKSQDVVHRVVGRPGIILVGEGNPNRVRNLLTVERKKHARVAPDAPIHEIVVGNEPGQVPLKQLVKHVRKLRREIRPADMTEVLQRLKALDAMRPQAPLPRGPVPTSMKGARKLMQGRGGQR